MQIDNRTLVLGMFAAGLMTSAAIIRAEPHWLSGGMNTASMLMAQDPSDPSPPQQAPPNPPDLRSGLAGRNGFPQFPQGQTSYVEVFDPTSGATVSRPVFSYPPSPMPGYSPENAEIWAAVKTIQAAETEESREAAQAKLREFLRKQFDEDLQRRQKDLEAIETRVKEMRQKLDKRIQAADEIVDLRLQVLLQDAEGLGWSGANGMYPLNPPIPPNAAVPTYPVPAYGLAPSVGQARTVYGVVTEDVKGNDDPTRLRLDRLQRTVETRSLDSLPANALPSPNFTPSSSDDQRY